MATTKRRRKKPTSRTSRRGFAGLPGSGSSSSKALTVGAVIGSALAGAAAGSVLGRLSLVPGILVAGYGALSKNNNLVAAGACMAMAPEVVTTPSTKTGISAQIENATNTIKAVALTTGRKAFLDKVVPSLVPPAAATIGAVDYYAIDQYQGAAQAVAGIDQGYYDGGDGSVGRLQEASYQAAEYGGTIGEIGEIGDLAGYDDEGGIAGVDISLTY